MIALVSGGETCALSSLPDFILSMLTQVGKGEALRPETQFRVESSCYIWRQPQSEVARYCRRALSLLWRMGGD